MHKSLDLFQTATAMARHAGSRQAVVARNIANADTPGFQSQSISAFRDVYKTSSDATVLQRSRPGHMAGERGTSLHAPINTNTSNASPNGNTVSLEDELLSSVAISREHNRALTIYRHALTMIRTSLGRG